MFIISIVLKFLTSFEVISGEPQVRLLILFFSISVKKFLWFEFKFFSSRSYYVDPPTRTCKLTEISLSFRQTSDSSLSGVTYRVEPGDRGRGRRLQFASPLFLLHYDKEDETRQRATTTSTTTTTTNSSNIYLPRLLTPTHPALRLHFPFSCSSLVPLQG